MNNMYTLQEAREIIKVNTNGEYDVDKYNGSRETCTFRHNTCNKSFDKRWADFVEYFRVDAEPICPICKK